MACYPTYNWLVDLLGVEVFSYLLASFVSVHDGHLKIHQDQVKAAVFTIMWVNIVFDIIKSLLAIVSFYADFFVVINTKTFKDESQSHKVISFIIYYKNSLVIKNR